MPRSVTLPPRPPRWNGRTFSILLALGAIALSLFAAGLGQQAVWNPNGLPQFGQFFQASLHPDLSRAFLGTIARATGVTFAYAVCGTVLSLGLGLIGGLLSAAVGWRLLLPQRPAIAHFLWLTVRGILAVPRAIHELIWGLLLLNLIGLDPLVAVGAIAIPFGAIVAKVFSEILDETPPEPLQALLGAGAPPLAALLYGLLPQALPNLLSYSFYRFECSLRSSAVLGVIGAGGLGYEMLLSLQSLRYEQLWTAFYALIALNGVVDIWSAWVRRQMGFTSRLDINAGRRRSPPAHKPTDHHKPGARWALRLSMLGVAIATPLCFWALDLDWTQLWASETRAQLSAIVQAARPAALSLGQVSELARLAGLTLTMSILAIAVAGLGSLLFSVFAAQTLWLPGGVLRPLGEASGWPLTALALLGLSRLALLVSRAIPAPIWALVLLYVLFPGILPGALALGIHNFGILGRLMAEVNENVDDRPIRALRNLGAPAPTVVLYGMLPQNLSRFLAYILYRWEVCLRETVIVGLVGAGGLGRRLTEQLSSFDYGGLTVTLGAFMVLTFGVDLVSAAMRRSLR